MAGSQANIANFFAPLRGPGRSAASLHEDLILYDPRQPSQPGHHLLDDGAYAFGHGQHIGQLLSDSTCVHDYRLKPRQSAPPQVDEKASSTSVWQVAAICQKCRIHLLLVVDFTAAWQDEPCPTWFNPLHHLVRSAWRQDAALRDLQRGGSYESDEVHVYECSAKKCSAIVTVHLSPPVIPDEAIHVLVDRQLLAQRTVAAFEAKAGHTEGMKRPSPTDVLADLRAYMRNAWTRDIPSEISLDNKRFVVRFGPDGAACAKVLELLGFELKPGSSWVVPQPIANDTAPLQEPHNIRLDNIEAELDALIATRPEDERIASPDSTNRESANLQISRVLSSQNYDCHPASRSKQTLLWNRPRAFTVLGIPEAASDDLVIWAYQRQIMLEGNQPAQTAKLMTALEDVQRQRQSDQLSQQVGIERSMGRYGEQTIADAYRSLGLPPSGDVDDQTIIGSFDARLCDAPMQEQQMRESLAALGEIRNSRRLKDYAHNTVSSYEDALKFLDAATDTDDSFLISMYASKVGDSPHSQDMARKAVQLIAEHRHSDALKSFVESGFQTDGSMSTMDIGEAYSLFGISDRTFDDDALWAVFEMHMEESYGSRDRLRQAMLLIADDKGSQFLREKLQPTGSMPVMDEPVGLDNIGNTCYLNSLLQSLFTITAVREIVLNFSAYKQDLNSIDLSGKRVGQRAVTIREIRSAQNFVTQLADLFRQMITIPARAVRPTQELARLTLETNVAKERRSSTLQSDRRPTLGMIDNKPVMGPLPQPIVVDDLAPPLLSPDEIDEAISIQPSQNEAQSTLSHNPDSASQAVYDDGDNASDETLVSQTQSVNGEHTPDTDSPLQEEMNDNPIEREYTSSTTKKHIQDQSPTSDGTVEKISVPENIVSSDTIVPGSKDESNGDAPEIPEPQYKPPPGPPPRPPPIPPRPTAISTLEEYARQQDVTEVLGHAIIQLSCAIRSTGVDSRGEQQDEVHDTFYGEECEFVLSGPGAARAPIPFLYPFLQISNEPKDLYGAFDNYFDLKEQGSNELYSAITKLPPVLCFGLGRVLPESNRTSRKCNHHVELPTTLFMDRYMDAPQGSVLFERKMQTWQYKKELRILQSRIEQLEPKGAKPADEQLTLALAAIQHLAEVSVTDKIEGLVMETETVNTLSELAQRVRDERIDLRKRITLLEQQIADSFTDAIFRKQEYRLHALFFHRGTANSGHYWIYIFDHINEIWRKYNDDNVTQVTNLKEIFSDPRNDKTNPNFTASAPANPYFLMYVRNDRLGHEVIEDNVVETVKRNPLPPPPIPEIREPDSSNGAYTGDEMIDLRPLGTDTPKEDQADSSHHEFAGQVNQMSYMPPNAPRLQGQDPSGHQDQEYANIGSVLQQNRPSTQHTKKESWDEVEMRNAIERSLQSQPKKVGDWDDSENMEASPNVW